MDNYAKTPKLLWAKLQTFLFASFCLGFLIIGTLSLLPFQGQANLPLNQNEISREKLAIFNKNTLLPIVSPVNSGPSITKSLTVIVTAYSSTPCQTDDTPFITASNTRVRDGIIANNKFPFGTQIKFPEIFGDKVFVFEDRMNRRKGPYRFDIWFPSYVEALDFGIKETYILVLES